MRSARSTPSAPTSAWPLFAAARGGGAEHRRRPLPARQPRCRAGQLRREPRPFRGGWRPAERRAGSCRRSAVTEIVAARFDRAADLYKRSGAICTSADDGDCAARAIAGLAFAQSAQERFFDAAASYRKAIDAFTALRLREEAARSEIGLSQALAGAGDFAGGVEAAARARHEAHGHRERRRDVAGIDRRGPRRAQARRGERALGISRAAVSRAGSNGGCRARQAREQPDDDATGAVATFAVLLAERVMPTGHSKRPSACAPSISAPASRSTSAISRAACRPQSAKRSARSRRAWRPTWPVLPARRACPSPIRARIAALQQSLDEATAQRRAWMAGLFERLPDLAAWRGLAKADATPDLKALVSDERSLLLSFVLDEEALLMLTVTPPPVAPDDRSGGFPRSRLPGLCRPDQAPPDRGMTRGDQPSGTERRHRLEEVGERADRVVPVSGDRSHRRGQPVADRSARRALARAVRRAARGRRLPGRPAANRRGRIGGDARPCRRTAPAANTGVTVLGVPQLTAARIERVRQIAPAWSLRTEDEAAKELQAASGEPDRTTTLTGAAATEQALRDAIGRAGILHLATPFRINSASPLFSSALLSSPETPAAAPPSPPPMLRQLRPPPATSHGQRRAPTRPTTARSNCAR